MEHSTLAEFIDKVTADEGLRQRVFEAEKAAIRDIEFHRGRIAQIAADAGYDISDFSGRPDMHPMQDELDSGDTCTFTCCFTWTSTS
jgi:hypothetical protein